MDSKIYNFKKFYNEKREFIEALKLEGSTENAIELKLDYLQGDGIVLNISPINITYSRGYQMQEFLAFTNLRFRIASYTRKNAKQEKAAIDKILPLQDKIIDIFLNNNKDAAANIIYNIINN